MNTDKPLSPPLEEVLANKTSKDNYSYEIKDLTTEKVDTCLQCSFNITDNDVEVQHLEINIYPGEMDYFNGLMAQIFRV